MKDIFVKEGYTLLAIIQDPQGGGLYHAIIDRKTSFLPFIYCWAYDITDGTWGQGHYCNTYEEALHEMLLHTTDLK